MFRTPVHGFFCPDFLRRGSKYGSSYRGQNYIEMIGGETEITSRNGMFQLSRVRVAEGKITVHV